MSPVVTCAAPGCGARHRVGTWTARFHLASHLDASTRRAWRRLMVLRGVVALLTCGRGAS